MPIPAKILVVDDQQFVRETVCALLMQQSHWEIYEAADGRTAIDRARGIQPDVVVMDLAMPKMNGLAAAYEQPHSIGYLPDDSYSCSWPAGSSVPARS